MGLFGKIFGGGGEPKPPRWARAFETKARAAVAIAAEAPRISSRSLSKICFSRSSARAR